MWLYVVYLLTIFIKLETNNINDFQKEIFGILVKISIAVLLITLSYKIGCEDRNPEIKEE